MHRLGINSDFTLRRHDCAQRDRPLDGAGFISTRFRHRERKKARCEISRLRVGRRVSSGSDSVQLATGISRA